MQQWPHKSQQFFREVYSFWVITICRHRDRNQDDNMTYFMVVVGIKLYFEKFSCSHSKLDSVLLSLTFVVWKQTGQVCVRSILCLFVVLVVWLTCLAPVTPAELGSATLLAVIVNPAGVCDSDYLMPELGSVRLISAWQPTWEVELRSVGQLIAE